MPEPVTVPPEVAWTPTELRKLPRAERNAILAQAAAQAGHEYRTNRELTEFEAFDEDTERCSSSHPVERTNDDFVS